MPQSQLNRDAPNILIRACVTRRQRWPLVTLQKPASMPKTPIFTATPLSPGPNDAKA